MIVTVRRKGQAHGLGDREPRRTEMRWLPKPARRAGLVSSNECRFGWGGAVCSLTMRARSELTPEPVQEHTPPVKQTRWIVMPGCFPVASRCTQPRRRFPGARPGSRRLWSPTGRCWVRVPRIRQSNKTAGRCFALASNSSKSPSSRPTARGTSSGISSQTTSSSWTRASRSRFARSRKSTSPCRRRLCSGKRGLAPGRRSAG